jgi:hypothetical protein
MYLILRVLDLSQWLLVRERAQLHRSLKCSLVMMDQPGLMRVLQRLQWQVVLSYLLYLLQGCRVNTLGHIALQQAYLQLSTIFRFTGLLNKGAHHGIYYYV